MPILSFRHPSLDKNGPPGSPGSEQLRWPTYTQYRLELEFLPDNDPSVYDSFCRDANLAVNTQLRRIRFNSISLWQPRILDWISSILSQICSPMKEVEFSFTLTVSKHLSEKSLGSASKSNEGQVEQVQKILSLLRSEGHPQLSITVLSPYSKQILQMKSKLRPPTPCFTIDYFQGRESDIIIFSSVRSNTAGEIGFVEDARRLNVMWTRAKLALIIVGDRRTMTTTSELWKRAIDSCEEVRLDVGKSES